MTRTLNSLNEIRQTVIDLRAQGHEVYIRYSLGPEIDRKRGYSIDHQSGTRHAGLSANNLFDSHGLYEDGEIGYVAMNTGEYAYLLMQGNDGTRAWICTGREVGRDSDNAPVICDVELVAWVSDDAVHEAVRLNLAIADLRESARRAPFAQSVTINAEIRRVWREGM